MLVIWLQRYWNTVPYIASHVCQEDKQRPWNRLFQKGLEPDCTRCRCTQSTRTRELSRAGSLGECWRVSMWACDSVGGGFCTASLYLALPFGFLQNSTMELAQQILLLWALLYTRELLWHLTLILIRVDSGSCLFVGLGTYSLPWPPKACMTQQTQVSAAVCPIHHWAPHNRFNFQTLHFAFLANPYLLFLTT